MPALRHATWLTLVILPSLFLLLALRRTLARYLAPAYAAGIGPGPGPGPSSGPGPGFRAPAPPWGDSLLITYALGTLAFTFSTLVFGHQPTAVFLFLAFFVITQIRTGERSLAGSGPPLSSQSLGHLPRFIAHL